MLFKVCICAYCMRPFVKLIIKLFSCSSDDVGNDATAAKEWKGSEERHLVVLVFLEELSNGYIEG